VVVDNTNPSAEVRGLYMSQARQHGIPVRCFHFITALDVSKHLNMFREKLTKGEHKHVPRIAYNVSGCAARIRSCCEGAAVKFSLAF
jgi:hypothetical protein